MSLKVFGHYVSQPTRAVLWTLAMKKVPHTFIKVNPVAGECDAEPFLRKFPQGVIPAIEEEDGFRLSESNAILTYLAAKHQWADLYPTDPRHRAQVDMWLHWHHSNTRQITTHFFRPRMLAVMGLRPLDKGEVESDRRGERAWRETALVMLHGALKSQPFLVGDRPTLADIALYCEVDQLVALKLVDFSQHPEIERWISRMRELPAHDEVRRSMEKLCAKIHLMRSQL